MNARGEKSCAAAPAPCASSLASVPAQSLPASPRKACQRPRCARATRCLRRAGAGRVQSLRRGSPVTLRWARRNVTAGQRPTAASVSVTAPALMTGRPAVTSGVQLGRAQRSEHPAHSASSGSAAGRAQRSEHPAHFSLSAKFKILSLTFKI